MDYRVLKSVHESAQQDLLDMSGNLELINKNNALQRKEIGFAFNSYQNEILSLENELQLAKLDCQKIIGGTKKNHQELFTKSMKLERLEKDYLLSCERWQLEKAEFLDRSAIVSQNVNDNLNQLNKTKLILQEYKERVLECESKLEKMNKDNLEFRVMNNELLIETKALTNQIKSLNAERLQLHEMLQSALVENAKSMDKDPNDQPEQVTSKVKNNLLSRELFALESTKNVKFKYINRMRRLPTPATNDSLPRLNNQQSSIDSMQSLLLQDALLLNDSQQSIEIE